MGVNLIKEIEILATLLLTENVIQLLDVVHITDNRRSCNLIQMERVSEKSRHPLSIYRSWIKNCQNEAFEEIKSAVYLCK